MSSQSNQQVLALHRLVDVLLFVGPSGCGKSTIIQRLQKEWPQILEFSVSHTTRAPRHGEVHGEHYHFVSKEEFCNLVRSGKMVEYSRLSTAQNHEIQPTATKPSSTSSLSSSSPSSLAASSSGSGNYYGTSKAALHSVLQKNKIVLMDTDLLGAIYMRRYCNREVADTTSPMLVKRNQTSSGVSMAAAHKEFQPQQPASPASPWTGSGQVGEGASRLLRCMVIFIAPPSMESLEARLRHRKSETAASLQMRLDVSRRWMAWADENKSFFDYYLVNDDLDACYAKVKSIVKNEVVSIAKPSRL